VRVELFARLPGYRAARVDITTHSSEATKIVETDHVTVHVSKSDGTEETTPMVRATGPGVIGDPFEHLSRGETVLGKTYDEWAAAAAGDGTLVIDESWPPIHRAAESGRGESATDSPSR
jgi:hypothetical protein